jgi:hypothetical protein
LGLTLDHDQSIRWSVTNVPAPTAARYAVEVAALDAALVDYRLSEPNGAGRKSNNNGVSPQCECGRKTRVSRSVLDAGPITRGVCDAPFEAVEE